MTITTLPEALLRPIQTKADALRWLDNLIAADLAFHLEDSPANIVDMSDAPVFSGAAIDQMAQRVAELYAQEWGADYACPIGFLLEHCPALGGTPRAEPVVLFEGEEPDVIYTTTLAEFVRDTQWPDDEGVFMNDELQRNGFFREEGFSFPDWSMVLTGPSYGMGALL